ncbi:MAG: hypothetical protein QOJ55_32 [Solirubrobacteraceae bacterium]|nr:hypothetical protein [Solirubrobacteraceae bacterium]
MAPDGRMLVTFAGLRGETLYVARGTAAGGVGAPAQIASRVLGSEPALDAAGRQYVIYIRFDTHAGHGVGYLTRAGAGAPLPPGRRIDGDRDISGVTLAAAGPTAAAAWLTDTGVVRALTIRDGHAQAARTTSPRPGVAAVALGPLSVAVASDGHPYLAYLFGVLDAVHVVDLSRPSVSPQAVSPLGASGPARIAVDAQREVLVGWSAAKSEYAAILGNAPATYAPAAPRLRASALKAADLRRGAVKVTTSCSRTCIVKLHFGIYTGPVRSYRERVSAPQAPHRTLTQVIELSSQQRAALRRYGGHVSMHVYAVNAFGNTAFKHLTVRVAKA